MTLAILTVDTREQLYYTFEGCASKHVAFEIRRATLATGDYSARLDEDDGPAATAVVERKTYSDLLGSLTFGRDRFERELERMREYGFKALVIEADLALLAQGSPQSKVTPGSVIASLIAFSQRFNLHVAFAGDRPHAQAYTFRLAERWVRDRAEALKLAETVA